MHHYLLECRPIRGEYLTNVDEGVRFMLEWAKVNGMSPVGEPIKYSFEINRIYPELKPGYSSIQCLKESHISLHTYPEYNLMHADLFSCKILKHEVNNAFFDLYFSKYKCNLVDRSFTIDK